MKHFFTNSRTKVLITGIVCILLLVKFVVIPFITLSPSCYSTPDVVQTDSNMVLNINDTFNDLVTIIAGNTFAKSTFFCSTGEPSFEMALAIFQVCQIAVLIIFSYIVSSLLTMFGTMFKSFSQEPEKEKK